MATLPTIPLAPGHAYIHAFVTRGTKYPSQLQVECGFANSVTCRTAQNGWGVAAVTLVIIGNASYFMGTLDLHTVYVHRGPSTHEQTSLWLRNLYSVRNTAGKCLLLAVCSQQDFSCQDHAQQFKHSFSIMQYWRNAARG